MIGLRVTSESISDVGRKVADGGKSGMRDAVEHGFRVSQELVPVDTGELKESGELVDSGETISFRYTAEHAMAVEGGTDPHTITGAPLAFVWEDPPDWVREDFAQARDAGGRFATGWQVFLPEVEHPGTDAQPYMQPGFQAMAQRLREHGLSPHIEGELGGPV